MLIIYALTQPHWLVVAAKFRMGMGRMVMGDLSYASCRHESVDEIDMGNVAPGNMNLSDIDMGS